MLNVWYVISLVIVGVGILSLVGLVLASIFPILKIVKGIKARVDAIQKEQMMPLQTQAEHLQLTAERLKHDMEYKKAELSDTVQCLKDVGTNVQQLALTSRMRTKTVIEKVKSDPVIQAETEQWTQTALGYLKRQA